MHEQADHNGGRADRTLCAAGLVLQGAWKKVVMSNTLMRPECGSRHSIHDALIRGLYVIRPATLALACRDMSRQGRKLVAGRHDPPLIQSGKKPQTEPVFGYPFPMQQQQALLPKKPPTEAPHVPDTRRRWGCCAMMCGFVAFIVLVGGAISTVLHGLPGISSSLGRSEGCASNPWGGAAVNAVPGNETRFSDPLWQKWQASQLLSAWGLASGRRTFIAMAGAHPHLQLVSCAMCPLWPLHLAGCRSQAGLCARTTGHLHGFPSIKSRSQAGM